MTKSLFDFTVKDASGKPYDLSRHKGKAVLVVNVASKCGFTPQYKSLEALHQKYRDKGLVILGFPCNQFGSQEPGTNAEIQQFCELNYGVTFPVLDKVDVNGDNTDPLFAHLKNEAPGVLGSKAIKWNFTKFLIDPNGSHVERFASATDPEKLTGDIEKLLG
ncbi:MAG: glutathione peroxidase [Chitinophagaceae bacterium]|nr:glutathione peroxidase [Oligoflexus sp.]